MQTLVEQTPVAGSPWLERDQPGGVAQQTPLSVFPFIIGRGESANLQIDSGRVSREHVRIVHEQGLFQVQDLKSTNGTFVNGQRISQAALADGDLLVVADVQFTFFSGRQDRRNTATQVIGAEPSERDGFAAVDLIRGARRWQEMLTSRLLAVSYQPIVDLEDRRVMGYEALGDAVGIRGCDAEAQQVLLATDCRLTAWIRRLQRAVAVEEAATLPAETCLFLEVDPSEIGDGGLVDSFAELREHMPATQRMVVVVPEDACADAPYARQFRGQLNALEIGLACNGGPGGAVALLGRKDLCPEYFRLAPAVVDGIARSHQRQRQVRELADAARQAGCVLIAAGLDTREAVELCRELGCALGQGEVFAEVEGAEPDE